MTQPVSNMKNLVTYQEGSIVSKEIIKKPTGTVTLFAFDKDQGLSEHTARSTPWSAYSMAKQRSSSPENLIVSKPGK